MSALAPRAGPPAATTEGTRSSPFLRQFDTLSQRAYAAHSSHVIAVSRAITALILLLFVVTSTHTPAGQRDFSEAFAITFAVGATASLIISLRSWYLDFALSGIFIGFDILAFVVLTASRPVMDADAIALVLCLLAHILFVSVLRWRSGLAFVVAVFLNTFWIADLVLFEMPRGGIDGVSALRWVLFALLETLIVIWASLHKLRIALPRFAGESSAPGIPSMAAAIGYATETAGANAAVLCWLDPTDRGCYAITSQALEERRPPVKLSFSATEGFKNLALMLFDASQDKAIILQEGKLRASSAAGVPGRALPLELGVQAGICIPVDGDEGRAWLILTGVPLPGWGTLHLAEAIRSEVAQGMAWRAASTNALKLALFRLRRTVACDLHDSVAHSLAGAKFLLVALRSKIGADAEIAKEIDTIKEALDAEHLHVRRLIEQLRETDSDVRARNLIEDLDAVCQALGLRWQIDVELSDSDYRIQVPVWLSMEIQQIVREAISNGVRHGKASHVAIKCIRHRDVIVIEVTDNGAGFADPQSPLRPRSISERLGELGGSLEIQSGPELTTLRMSVPSAVGD